MQFIETSKGLVNAVDQAVGQVAQASPGFFVLSPCANEDGSDGFLKVPVVAWRLIDGIAHPITPEELPPHYGLQYPSGMVLGEYGSIFESAKKFMEHMLKEREIETSAAVARKGDQGE